MNSSVAKQLARLGADSVFYGLGRAVQKFIGFFLFPVFTRLLTPGEYGAQDVVFATVTILSYFLVLGLDSATARHYFDAKRSDEKKTVLSTYLWFEIGISAPAVALVIVFAAPISQLLFTDSSVAPFLRVAVASLPLSLIAGAALLAMRLEYRSKRFGVVTVCGVLVQAAASIYLVAGLNLGVMGIFIAQLLASALRAILAIVLAHSSFGLRLSTSYLRRLLAFGLPLVPASISFWIINYSNRLFLLRLGSLEDVGLLSAGTRIASIVLFLITAFRLAWGPFAYSIADNKPLAKATYSLVLRYFLLITLVTTVVLTVFAAEALLILATPQYADAAPLVPFLAYSAIAWGAAYIVGMGFGIAKKSYHTSIATIFAAGISIVGNIMLIRLWGTLGAATANMVGSIAALAYTYFAAQRYLRVEYEFSKIAALITSSSAVIAIALVIDYTSVGAESLLVSLVSKAILVVAFGASLLALKVVGKEEWTMVRTYLFPRSSSIAKPG